MRTELISIDTDALPLDGAFHRPDGEVEQYCCFTATR
jgi:hypothetical protein